MLNRRQPPPAPTQVESVVVFLSLQGSIFSVEQEAEYLVGCWPVSN